MTISVRVLACRRLVQVLVLLGVGLLPWVNALGWHGIMGNFYALYVGGVPFADPVMLTQNITAGFAPGWRLWLGAGIAMLLALLLGRFFCGWVCPYGLFSEWLWEWRGRRQAPTLPHADTSWTARVVLLFVGLVLTLLWGVPLLNAISAPGLLSLTPQLWHEGAWAIGAALAVPVALLALDGVAGQRLWCRYVCPQALALMAAAWLGRRWGRVVPVLAVRWEASCCTCKGEQPCAAACSMGLRPRKAAGPAPAHCVQCGDCVRACATRGKALSMAGRAEVSAAATADARLYDDGKPAQ